MKQKLLKKRKKQKKGGDIKKKERYGQRQAHSYSKLSALLGIFAIDTLSKFKNNNSDHSNINKRPKLYQLLNYVLGTVIGI